MAFFRSGNQSQQSPALSGVQIQTSVYGKCQPIVYGTNRLAPNLIWYGDFIAKAAPAAGGGKGGSIGGSTGKGGAGSSGYNYSASFEYGLCEGPIQGVGAVYVDKNVSTLSALGYTLFLGTYPQTAWAYLTSVHPDQALGYNGLAHVDTANYSLGNSASLPNHSFEIKGIFSNSVAGSPDADPSLVVADILTNAIYGVGFPAARLGDLTVFQSYCLATGMLISPVYDTQQQSSQMLDDLASNTNSAIVWSNGLLNIIPYGDESLSGNGATYTPPTSPLYDLTDDDFMPQSNSDPVMLTRSRQSDQMNNLKMEYMDNTNAYNVGVVEVKDQASIDQYGLRQDSTNSSHLFTNPQAATTSAQLQLQRESIRNVYTFTLDQRYLLLDPMDIVTLTDVGLSLNKQWVRILTIDEQDDYSLIFTAEEYLQGNGSAAQYGFQTGAGYSNNYNIDPGSPNVPVIFEPPVQIATNTGLETWMAVSGGNLWGGAGVYISTDDVTYKYVGRITGSARQGLLTTILPVGADPDTIDTITVDLTESNGELLSGTMDDADLGHTLCYVDGELISYQTATLTTANNYSLTYLRRGMYESPIGAHAKNSQFARLDNQIFVYPYDPSQIGTTIYVKLAGFNIWGGGQQSLADVTAVTHVIQGPPAPSNVINFGAKQVGDNVAFTWDQVVDFALEGYDIGYAAVGETDWNNFTLLTESAKGTEMTNASVPFGTFDFGIRTKDIAGQLSPAITRVTLTVVNTGNEVALQSNAPKWELGTLSGFVKHWTGVLVPANQFPITHYSNLPGMGNICPDPVSTASYTGPVIDIGYNDNVRVFGTITESNLPGTTGAPTNQTLLDYWLNGGTDPNTYIPWRAEFALLEFAKMRFTVTGITSGNVNIYTQFTVKLDKTQNTTQAGSQVVAIGGTTITFPTAFHSPPFVTGTVVSTSGLYMSASLITDTTAVLQVWDHTGTDVGGTVSWNATGE